MAVLAVCGLSVGYCGRPVLQDLDLELDAGLHLLIGPNGAGKTTLFRTLAGILPPTAGSVRLLGQDPHADAAVKGLVGVSGHRTALAPRLTVQDNLHYWARVIGIPAAERAERVRRAIGQLELAPIAGQRAGTLSRGQAQRVSLARAMVGDPPILLLDEPLSGVDPGAGVQIRQHLRALADAGHTLLVSTHELAEASEIGDDVTLLQHGRIAGHGSAEELRAGLGSSRLRVRLRAAGDALGALGRLGYRPETAPGGGVVVEVADDAEVERLVRDLVGAGIGIREVAPAANPLEDLYLRLQSTGGGSGA